MNPLTVAVLRAGLISPAMMREMRRLSPALKAEDLRASEGPLDLDEAAKIVESALQAESYVLVRETDLHVLQHYSLTAKPGLLHLEAGDRSEEFEVTFGRTPLGEVVIAWDGDTLRDLLANGFTYLRTDTEDLFFQDVRELFFGDKKSFIVCVPALPPAPSHAHQA